MLVSNWCGVAISSNATLTVVPSTNVVVTASDRGWYNDAGNHTPGSANHFVGNDGGAGQHFRNWFVFNLPSLSAPIAHAELRAYTYSIVAPTGSETYQLHEVITSPATVTSLTSDKEEFTSTRWYASP